MIKFRVWDNVDYMSKPFTLYDLMGSQAKIEFTHDCIVMQYTGLNDKDGQEIYEGDIMQSPDWGCVAIRWLPDLGCFGCWHPTTGIHDNLIGYSEAQVIGNIYQNPELLQSND